MGDAAVWQMKRLVKELSSARSFSSTSLISILIPPGTQLAKLSTMIHVELATASNIKQRVNKNLVIEALKSVQQRMKLVTKIPHNGLCMYFGTSEDGGEERKYHCVFEPIKPVPTFTYRCDNAFLTDVIEKMFDSNDKYGFLVFDGHGAVFGVLNGSAPQVIHKLTVSLPRKHNKGGQSSLRFARQRV
jgi:peptide chain release factor subunit 1